MTRVRTQNGGEHIPNIAVNIYYKNLEPPEISEGYTDIHVINKIHISREDPTLYYKYILYGR
jgi:hypothetical protein